MPKLYKRGDYWWTRVAGKRVSTFCRDKELAQVRAREFERRAIDPDGHAKSTALLHDALDLLILDRQGKASAGKGSAETVGFYQKKAAVLLWHLGDRDGKAFSKEARETGRLMVTEPLRLSQVTAGLVDDYIANRRARGVSDSAIHKELTTWRAAMRLAKRRQLWAQDLDAVFPHGFSPEYKARTRFMLPGEFEKLLEDAKALDMPESRREEVRKARLDLLSVVAFSVATSAEWSAIWRTEKGDVDLKRMIVHVRGSKTGLRDRHIPVVHAEHVKLIKFAMKHAGGTGAGLFKARVNFRRDLAAACKRAGILRMSPNDLRRTHAKWLRLGDVPAATIAPIMGHKDSRMVERVYGQVTPLDLREALTETLEKRVPNLYRRGGKRGTP